MQTCELRDDSKAGRRLELARASLHRLLLETRAALEASIDFADLERAACSSL